MIAEISTENRKGEQLAITVCPLCGAQRGDDYEQYATHLARHSWSDLGL